MLEAMCSGTTLIKILSLKPNYALDARQQLPHLHALHCVNGNFLHLFGKDYTLIDFAGPMNGRSYLVVVDAHTKCLKYFVMKNTTLTLCMMSPYTE